MRPLHWILIALLLAAVWGSFAYLSLDAGQLLSADGRAQMSKYVLSFFPPDLSFAYLAQTWRGAVETIAISAIGTLLAPP